MTDYPYMISNNKISLIISSLQSAAKPVKFTLEFLRNLGYTSTNDRGVIPLFKKLGFLTDDSVPTVYYDQLRDPTTYQRILALRIKELYAELFTINVEIYKDIEANIKGAISRVTGGDEEAVKRVYSTFKALCTIADFSQQPQTSVSQETPIISQPLPEKNNENSEQKHSLQFHYNIQIHLPATTDISVYNAIFKSLKDNLII
ncbi:MAG TPA: DUF5343 domain-containing protein [Oscillospiraceae bacterium]|nr:DUF5343 domain-containing protein [Oscillospiraceae bacterium]HRW57716.1 DUF5343 domain-containing protein [Oscillospiraceae bacterium]